jgi:hypothetical protein
MNNNLNLKYEIGEDLGLENWRISITRFNGFTFEIKNFDYGFRDGEQYDKLNQSYYLKRAEPWYLSILTRDKSKLEEYKQILLKAYIEVVNEYIRKQRIEILNINNDIELCEKMLNSDLFKQINRDEKLKKLGI